MKHAGSKVAPLISRNLRVAMSQGHQDVSEPEKLLVLTDSDSNAAVSF